MNGQKVRALRMALRRVVVSLGHPDPGRRPRDWTPAVRRTWRRGKKAYIRGTPL